MLSRKEKIQRRAERVRRKLKSVSSGRLRLSIYRSNQNIYAQIIDDSKGHTLVSSSTLDSALKDQLKSTSDKNAAAEVGKLLAQRALAAGIKDVVFDRGAYLYHGRVKSLAETAREGGLLF